MVTCNIAKYCLYVYTYIIYMNMTQGALLETLLSTAQHCRRSFSTLMNCVQNWLSCNCKVNMSGIFAYIHLHTGSVAADCFRSWSFWISSNLNDVILVHQAWGEYYSGTRLAQYKNINIPMILYSSNARVLIFQYSYSYVQYSLRPCDAQRC